MRKCGLWAAGAVVSVSLSSVAAVLENDSRVTFTAVLPDRESVTLSLGRGREQLSVASRDGKYPWRFTTTDGESPQSRPYPGSTRPEDRMSYWWEKCDYTPNGRYRRSFSVPAWVDDASEAMAAERHLGVNERKLRFAVELSDGWLSFYLDDILIHALKATADVAGRALSVRGSKGAVVSEQACEPKSSARGYYRVPLGDVATKDGNPVAALTSFRGVPILPCGKSVDVSKSWTREATVDEYGEPSAGVFGGRWAGALSATPCRLQFRVPNRRYEALYLVASCRERNFLTAQFYRPGSGFPVDCVPAEPIATDGELQLVRIPLRQDLLAAFADREILEFELTGRVENYRAHPEPSNTSRHGMGLPSGVVVHAITLKESALEIDFMPEAFGNLWVGLGTKPAYRLKLRNRTEDAVPAAFTLETRSWDGQETTAQTNRLTVAAAGEGEIRLELPLRKFGWHAVTLTVNGEKYERSLVAIRPRTYKARSFATKGHMFGCWPAESGVHYGLPAFDAARLLFPLGIEGYSFKNLCKRTDIAPVAKKYGVRDFTVVDYNTGREAFFTVPDLEEKLRLNANPVSEVSEPFYQNIFAEPGGIGRACSNAGLCGEPVTPNTPEEDTRYLFYKTNLFRFAEIYRRNFPGKKLMAPWGSPLFTAALLRDPETRNLMDGMSFDTAFFDRIAEGQVHSCSLYLVTLMNREWHKVRSDDPLIVSVEGPCLSRMAPESLTPAEQLNNSLRAKLILSANGVKRLMASCVLGPEDASYWGEQHYGGGGFSRITLNPHPVVGAEATIIRLLRDCEFVRAVPTGSLGVFALEYRNVVKGQPLHVLWTVRGRVPFKVKGGTVLDAMDNPKRIREATPEPTFVENAKGDFTFGAQIFDPAETTPAADAVKVGTLADWVQSTEAPDDEYLNSMTDHIRRHPVAMEVKRSGTALSVRLPESLPEVYAMPFTTTLVPPKPIVLPGRPKTIALETTAVPDWGRVVYVLRDAKGEKFVSVGQKETYNVDDTKCDSHFTFTGRRLIRFELPGNRPWDKSRFAGSCWWGAYGGDGVVDYPLAVEKVFVERRDRAMYVNDLVPADRSAILLGGLYVEDFEPESDLAMPPPPAERKRLNPIAEIVGTLPPTEITAVRQPTHYYDGTRGHFDFREMPEAAAYDVYVGLKDDGEGAILLKKGLKGSGMLVSGFLANTEHYGFVVWHDRKGATSRPSAPFKFKLKDEFAEK